MLREFTLPEPVSERDRGEWGSVAAELAGTQTRIIAGRRWHHRVITAGTDGPPLMMYHGIGGHAETFARNIRALANHFRVYAVDALFHGFSSKSDFSLPAFYDRLTEGHLDLLDALGFHSTHFFGESMGAQFGINLGIDHPERIDKAVLNAGFYLNKPDRPIEEATTDVRALGRLSKLAVEDPTTENVRNRMHWLVADPSSITDDIVSVRRAIYRDPEVNASLRRIFNLDGDGFGPHLYELSYDDTALKSWKPETLILWGEHNPGHGPDLGRYWADLMFANFYEVAGVGHWPHWEKPDEFNQVVTQFLTR
jgi:2-hydroxy-6-oxonona-2,4-dienedioate hydrolase